MTKIEDDELELTGQVATVHTPTVLCVSQKRTQFSTLVTLFTVETSRVPAALSSLMGAVLG